MRVADLEAIRIKVASPEDILSWSHGEVTKPETINYRTQKPEKDGLFDEKIFGPEKDYECYCGKYRGIRHKGIVCDKCGVEVTKSQVRRERMGHIKLASPVSHIWFLRGIPSKIGQILDLPMSHLEKVIYFNAYIVTKVDEEAKKTVLEQIDKEYSQKLKALKNQVKQKGKVQGKDQERDLKLVKDRAKEEVNSLKPLRVLSEVEYFDLSLRYGQCFEAGTGGETLKNIFSAIDLKKKLVELKAEAAVASPMNRKKVLRRIKLFQSMEKASIRPEWMFLTVLPVLPPDLRPMVQLDGGRYASSDLNDLYRRVINRNNRLKYLLEIGAPEVIVRNEKRMLQEAVDALIDNGMRRGSASATQSTTGGRRLLKSLADILKGKQGRFRQNLLGKRVDYSGRSVIVVGPELNLQQVGLPKKMALELFKPFVIKKILERELAYNVRGASRLIEQETGDIWAILEQVVAGKTVLLNRAPTLHRLGIQGFKPILIEGEAIRIHPLVCKAFNADFDGDQMAVHLPLSQEAQEEAEQIMLSARNLLKPATGLPIVSPTQDIILGCYWLTKIRPGAKGQGKIFASAQEAFLAHDFDQIEINAQIKIPADQVKAVQHLAEKGQFLETSVGRLIFNQALPADFAFQNQTMNSKKIEELIREVIEQYGIAFSQPILDKIKAIGFDGATRSGISWGMDDLQVPTEKSKLVEEAEKSIAELESHFQKGFLSKREKYQRSIEIWQKTKSEIEKLVPKALDENGSVFTIIDSGARGSWSQPVQMAGMKGLVINPVGRIIELPIKNSYKEGFDVLEYFLSTHGARKGTADTALRTSTAGYLTRRLVDVGHEVIIAESDCKDTKGVLFLRKEADDIGQNFLMKIVGRLAAEIIVGPDKKVIVKKDQVVNWQLGKEIVDKKVEQVRLRSPLSCKLDRGVCQKCYGWSLGSGNLVTIGEAVGVISAQAIGEPGTQLTMRTFHTGGVASASDITLGLPRVEEIFETRVPAGKGVISSTDGQVLEILNDKIVKVKLDQNPALKAKKAKKEVMEYEIPSGKGILVKAGDKVLAGQALCEGNIDLKELFKIIGPESCKKYIIQEVQKIYVSQGASIHDKHLEVIVSQMFSKLRVKDPGDSLFIPGEVISKTTMALENQQLKKDNKKQIIALPILLGISKVALATDSFLSAASFIETSRVLIKSAIEGKQDKLQGLKENVIIGKLIPAGTGLKK